MWDLVTRDYSKWMTADDVVNNVKRYARNGSIITFHDSLKSIDKLHFALPQALQWLKDQGYAFKIFRNPHSALFKHNESCVKITSLCFEITSLCFKMRLCFR